MEEKRKITFGGFSGSTIKMIAAITMLIDHVGAVIVERMLLQGGQAGIVKELYQLDKVLRGIGRISFPLFCFLLVEGFCHTHSRMKYGLRLMCFAFISEIPFDLAFTGKVFSNKYQNIFFTLFIGFCMMAVFHIIEERWKEKQLFAILLMLSTLLAGMGGALILKTDYDYLGVLSIAVLYICRRNRSIQMLGGALSFLWEMPAPAAFLIAAGYNGKRGFSLKYVFYVFYPVHLLILYLLAVNLGIA